MSYLSCPNCLTPASQATLDKPYEVDGRKVPGVHECPRCQAVFGDCYKGDGASIVRPWFAPQPVPVDDWRYFDLTVLGSNGIERRHGWFDHQTRLITQVG